MKEIIIDKVNEKLYYEKLENGLEVYLLPNTKVKSVYATITAKYGSANLNFVPINETKMIKTPLGVAHFLEHKLFEQKNGIDPFKFYSKSGTSCNAHTSFFNTTYEFFGVENFKENLKFLIEFVGELYLTDKLVEKEKGIIEQELKMYLDDPGWIIYDNCRKSSFSVNPVKDPIGGTVESIKKINKDILETCYNTFYHPSNMFIVITGNFSHTDAINIIKDTYSKKPTVQVPNIKTKVYKEPDEIAVSYKEENKNVDNNKFSYNIKINHTKYKENDLKTKLHYTYILFDLLFSSTSAFFEKASASGLLSYPLGIDNIIVNNHFLISLTGESDNPNDLFKLINKELENIKINKDDFEETKRKLISREIINYDKIFSLNSHIVNHIIKYGNFEANNIEFMNLLNYNDLYRISKEIDFRNRSTYLIRPN